MKQIQTMNKIQRVERHIIKQSDKRFKRIKELCHLSKNLYNYANYQIRKVWISDNSNFPKEYDLTFRQKSQLL